MSRIGFVGLVCLIAAPSTSAWAKESSNDVTVCVDVVTKTHKPRAVTTAKITPDASDAPSPPPVKADEELSEDVMEMLRMWEAEERKKIRSKLLREQRRTYAFAPRSYLKRMLEHYITYERGFAAVETKCSERLTVELYPLNKGWTAFAYYSGHQQEEKVDQIEYAEFARFAKRVVTALLYNKRIEQTIDRLSVLKADSIQNIETVKGTHHVTAAVGSSFQFPIEGMATAVSADGAPENQFRLLTPVNLQLGYRGSFTSWCVEAYTRFGFGVSRKAQINNVEGGHVDHVLDMNLGLAFLWYMDPNGFNSFYTGTGASFDLRWYESVDPKSNPNHLNNDKLFGAGVSLHGILGYEFLRTSRIRAFTQLEVNLPAYRIDAENDITSLKTWMPGATLTAGVMF
jgi:hypothetical protein